jgi:hypothetical protein
MNGMGPSFGKNGNGRAAGPVMSRRCARRIVLLRGGDEGAVCEVLLELRDGEVSGKRLHAEVQRLAAEHAGELVAAEWAGPLGWTRFLWCRKDCKAASGGA